MISKNDASKITVLEIEKIFDQIRDKFESIEFDSEMSKESFYIKCNFKEQNTEITDITVRFIFDNERQNPKIPKNLTEYLDQGGNEKLIEKFASMDKNAWKCEVFSYFKDNRKLEYGVGINESNFSEKEMLELFKNYLLK